MHFQHKTAPELSIPQPERRGITQEFSVKPFQMHRYHLHKLSKQTQAQQKHASNCNQDTNSAQYKIFIITTGGVTVCCADAHKPVYYTYERSRFASFTWTQSSDWSSKPLGRVPRNSSLWVNVLCQRFCKTDTSVTRRLIRSERDLKFVAVNIAAGVGNKLPSVLSEPQTFTVHSPIPRTKSGMLGNTSEHLLKSRKARSDCKDPRVLNQPTTRAPAQTQVSRCSSSFHFLSELLSNICVSF